MRTEAELRAELDRARDLRERYRKAVPMRDEDDSTFDLLDGEVTSLEWALGEGDSPADMLAEVVERAEAPRQPGPFDDLVNAEVLAAGLMERAFGLAPFVLPPGTPVTRTVAFPTWTKTADTPVGSVFGVPVVLENLCCCPRSGATNRIVSFHPDCRCDHDPSEAGGAP